jgi:F-type H+-transporting ATPase subunit gamma
MALKDIKAKILATKRMNTVTRAMEAVSAVKMRKTQERAFSGRPYASSALAVLARLSGTAQLASHPLVTKREVKKIALIVITSDKGLAGALNSGVLKKAAEAVKEYETKDVTVYAYGKKGEEFFRRREYHVAEAFENKQDDVEVSIMERLSSDVSKGFLDGSFDEVVAIYSNFKSTFEQLPTMRTLLPLSLESVTELVKDIQPVRGKWKGDEVNLTAPSGYSIEPEAAAVLDALIPRLVSVSLYHMLLESKASEHSSRMVAMKNASDKSKEVARDLTRVYNKIRQAAITREVSEIVSGREALAT